MQIANLIVRLRSSFFPRSNRRWLFIKKKTISVGVIVSFGNLTCQVVNCSEIEICLQYLKNMTSIHLLLVCECMCSNRRISIDLIDFN